MLAGAGAVVEVMVIMVVAPGAPDLHLRRIAGMRAWSLGRTHRGSQLVVAQVFEGNLASRLPALDPDHAAIGIDLDARLQLGAAAGLQIVEEQAQLGDSVLLL